MAYLLHIKIGRRKRYEAAIRKETRMRKRKRFVFKLSTQNHLFEKVINIVDNATVYTGWSTCYLTLDI